MKLPRRGQFVSDSLSDPPRLSAEVAGGASSTMGRRYGWAADHVSAFDVVTADGRLRRVSAWSDADLFSAMLGGRGNFGVVTAMEFALFPVTRLYAGALFYSGEHTRNVLNAYRRLTATAPEDVSTGLALFNLPPLQDVPPFMRGRLAVSLRVSYVGDAGAGERLIEPLRRAAPVLMVIAEHGFSALVTVRRGAATHTVLFDTGLSPDGMAVNMEQLGVDVGQIEVVVLSHGHLDHDGGFPGLARLRRRSGLPLTVHPLVFSRRRFAIPDRAPWELPTLSRSALEAEGLEVIGYRRGHPLRAVRVHQR